MKTTTNIYALPPKSPDNTTTKTSRIDDMLRQLHEEIRLDHKSLSTEKSYSHTLLRSKNMDQGKQTKGLKHDEGKQPLYATPLVMIEPLADVFWAGEQKYATFNCLQPFDDSSRRFYDGMMRHIVASQIDPLARDEETGCYHLAQTAFNALARLYHARQEQQSPTLSDDMRRMGMEL